MSDRLLRQRFELKYQISEPTALAVRDFIRQYAVPDEFAAASPDYAYPVYSIYLDSPDLHLYRSALHGDCNRFKLRLRYYSPEPNQPVFAEIKRRQNSIILKDRIKLSPTGAKELAAGQFPTELSITKARDHQALNEFLRRACLLNAVPTSRVVYQREAWAGVGAESDLRITLDRQVCSDPLDRITFSCQPPQGPPVFGNTVILELKFTDRFPGWFQQLVQRFQLQSQGAAKYVAGLEQAGLDRPAIAFA